MNVCSLCQRNVADQTGSHIIPHFLMKRIDNEKGSNSRDKELGFRYGKLETNSYYGRSILPETLETIFGKEKPDESYRSGVIIDHLLCNSCEKAISKIESEYAKTLNSFNEQSYYSKISSGLAFLFWISILWRVSVTGRLGLNLSLKEISRLQRILNKYLAVNDDLYLDNTDPDLQNIGWKLLRSPEYPNATALYINPYHSKPYCVMIGEFLQFFYFNRNHEKGLVQSFLGSEKILHQAPLNTPFTGEIILPIKKELASHWYKALFNFMAEERLKSYDWMFNQVYKKFFGKESMPKKIKMEIIQEILSEKPIGIKYTHDELVKAMYKVVSRYQKP